MDEYMISNDSFQLLELMYEGKGLPEPVDEEQLRQLLRNGLARYSIIGHHRTNSSSTGIFGSSVPVYYHEITEDGKAYVELIHRNKQKFSDQLDTWRDIANQLEQRVKIAENDSAEARIDARHSAIRSWIAIGISVAALALEIIIQIL